MLSLEKGRYRQSRKWANLGKPEAPQNFFFKRKDYPLRTFPPLLNARDRRKKNHLIDKKLFTRTAYLLGTALSLNLMLCTRIVNNMVLI